MAAKNMEMEVKVGAFVAIGVGLLMVAILALGSVENVFSRANKYSVHFSTVEGLISGAKVVLGGMTVGTVDSIDLDPVKQNIQVMLSVNGKYGEWVRADTEAEISTQGMLGDKYVMLTTGHPDKPKLETGAEIPPRQGKDLAQFLSKGDQLMVSLNSIASSLDRVLKGLEKGNRSDTLFEGLASTSKNLAALTDKLDQTLAGPQLKSAIKNLNGILEKVNNGSGTVGALINDPGLYDDAKSLMGGANRSRILRNLVRQTIKENEAAEVKEATPKKK
jgi:phospholipid/cholesterol/gamma-HCH transport system substrate-binding protein